MEGNKVKVVVRAIILIAIVVCVIPAVGNGLSNYGNWGKTEEQLTSQKTEQQKADRQERANDIANSYAKNGTSCSPQDCYQEIIDYGYTQEEAVMAVSQVDADWNEHAFNKVKTLELYSLGGSPSEESLIAGLRDAGFTDENINYALSKYFHFQKNYV